MQDQPLPLRFPLSSEQCEMLAAFETAASLAGLAKAMRRDISVISRQLSALASAAPVLEKQSGRWRLTAFGRQINNLSHATAAAQGRILGQELALRLSRPALPAGAGEAALVLVGVQQGWDDPAWGARNNPMAESIIAAVIAAWRQAGRLVVHCRHVSSRIGSPLRSGSAGSEFKPEGIPRSDELVLEKEANSAFVRTELETRLKQAGCRALVMVGFTTNHCVDATARSAAELGLHAFIVADATAAFDRIGWDGRLFKGEALHAAALASLSQEFATVITSDDLLANLSEHGIDA